MKYWKLLTRNTQQYWGSLNNRDQLILLCGSAIVSCLLCYAFLIAPIINHFNKLEKSITHKKTMIHWMAPATKRWQHLQQQGFALSHSGLNQALDKQIVQEFSSLNLSHYPLKVSALNSNTVTIYFAKVPFDSFISQTNKLWLQNGLVVKKMKIKRVYAGVVSVSGTLEKSVL